MSEGQLHRFTTRHGALKSQDFHKWIRELIDQLQASGVPRPTLVLDNAPAHAGVEDVVGSDEGVLILRLAPYSYLLNPIELMWSAFKADVERQLRQRMVNLAAPGDSAAGMTLAEYRMAALEDIASRATNSISTQSLLGYTRRVEVYYAAVPRGET